MPPWIQVVRQASPGDCGAMAGPPFWPTPRRLRRGTSLLADTNLSAEQRTYVGAVSTSATSTG